MKLDETYKYELFANLVKSILKIHVFCCTQVKQPKVMPHTCYFDNIPIAAGMELNNLEKSKKLLHLDSITTWRGFVIPVWLHLLTRYIIIISYFFHSLPGHVF